MSRIHIVAGIILNSEQTHVFIAKRPIDKHKGGFWEFPGGKVEPKESLKTALNRELNEELGIQVTFSSIFEQFDYDYSDKLLSFSFMLVTGFTGKPYGREGQQTQWVALDELDQLDFPEANRPIVTQLVIEYTKKV